MVYNLKVVNIDKDIIPVSSMFLAWNNDSLNKSVADNISKILLTKQITKKKIIAPLLGFAKKFLGFLFITITTL
ncbi:MAG: hypothetical protein P8H40_07855 [Winogradskyella sp.]|nr:hypothetical protein [Winogradskyella sp.]MDG1661272.1 hypothetical protein [Winogradskyella sp.]